MCLQLSPLLHVAHRPASEPFIGSPSSSHATASPSIRHDSTFSASAARAISGKRPVQSCPLRVKSRTPVASRAHEHSEAVLLDLVQPARMLVGIVVGTCRMTTSNLTVISIGLPSKCGSAPAPLPNTTGLMPLGRSFSQIPLLIPVTEFLGSGCLSASP